MYILRKVLLFTPLRRCGYVNSARCYNAHKPLTSQPFKAQLVKWTKKFDRVAETDMLMFKNDYSAYLTGCKWLILGCLVPATTYKAIESIYKVYSEKHSNIHPSRHIVSQKIGVAEAVFGLVISAVMAFAMLGISHVTVRRMYYRETTDMFIMIVSRIIGGNKKIIVKPGELIVNEHLLLNHKLGSKYLYVATGGFERSLYYHRLIGNDLTS